MLSNPFLKILMIRKCERKAYSVSGAPVVTLGVVEIEFKLNGCSFRHQFTILRGLIHPMLLGLDFLTKHSANIQLDYPPRLALSHPIQHKVVIPFIKPAQKPNPLPRVSLVTDIEIPPLSTCYVDAYISNLEMIEEPPDAQPNRLFGITSIQQEEPTFDPGFIMRNGVVDGNLPKFKVELINPSQFKLKAEANTPIGAIFDDNCEIMEGDQSQHLWETPAETASEAFMRQQTLLAANINVVEVEPADNPSTAAMAEHLHHPTRPPSTTTNESSGEQIREAPNNSNKETTDQTSPPAPPPADAPPNSAFTPAYADSSTPLKHA